MGGSLLQRWLSDERFSSITVIEPSGLPTEFASMNLPEYAAAADIPTGSRFDLIILAVKPQTIKEVCQGLKPFVSTNTLILSIAAGTAISLFEGIFGHQAAIVRTMPNTPAAIGQGATVAIANAACSPAHKAAAEKALHGTGLVEWIEDESLMNAVTALSGSGPAYVFYLIEILEKAGANIGLPADLSGRLARQTVIGSAALAAASPETPVGTLRQNVTSPGGTTAAALEVLMNGEFHDILTRALQAAKRRGEELGG